VINEGGTCSDGNACTLDDICTEGTCGGAAKDCADTNGCTDDSCNTATGACVNSNNTDACDDGDDTTTNDVCGGGDCAGEGPGDGDGTSDGDGGCSLNSLATTGSALGVSGLIAALGFLVSLRRRQAK
jgi:hypothetical protein